MPTPPDFDRLYAADPDPWEVATSWYERRKIDVALACLTRERYGLAWDAACGTGELAARLVDRCDAVVATDLSREAIALTGVRVAGLSGVVVETSALPARPGALTAAPDLVVLSEVLYYLDEADRAATYALVDGIAAADAEVVLVNWAPEPEDAHTSGIAAFNEANAAFNAFGWGRLVTHTDVEFVAGCWSRDVPERLGR